MPQNSIFQKHKNACLINKHTVSPGACPQGLCSSHGLPRTVFNTLCLRNDMRSHFWITVSSRLVILCGMQSDSHEEGPRTAMGDPTQAKFYKKTTDNQCIRSEEGPAAVTTGHNEFLVRVCAGKFLGSSNWTKDDSKRCLEDWKFQLLAVSKSPNSDRWNITMPHCTGNPPTLS